MVEIGQTCREWRKSNGITQAFIAKYAGVSRAHVCRFEHGGVGSNRLLCVYLELGLDVGLDEIIDYLARGGVACGKEGKTKIRCGKERERDNKRDWAQHRESQGKHFA